MHNFPQIVYNYNPNCDRSNSINNSRENKKRHYLAVNEPFILYKKIASEHHDKF